MAQSKTVALGIRTITPPAFLASAAPAVFRTLDYDQAAVPDALLGDVLVALASVAGIAFVAEMDFVALHAGDARFHQLSSPRARSAAQSLDSSRSATRFSGSFVSGIFKSLLCLMDCVQIHKSFSSM